MSARCTRPLTNCRRCASKLTSSSPRHFWGSFTAFTVAGPNIRPSISSADMAPKRLQLGLQELDGFACHPAQ